MEILWSVTARNTINIEELCYALVSYADSVGIYGLWKSGNCALENVASVWSVCATQRAEKHAYTHKKVSDRGKKGLTVFVCVMKW